MTQDIPPLSSIKRGGKLKEGVRMLTSPSPELGEWAPTKLAWRHRLLFCILQWLAKRWPVLYISAASTRDRTEGSVFDGTHMSLPAPFVEALRDKAREAVNSHRSKEEQMQPGDETPHPMTRTNYETCERTDGEWGQSWGSHWSGKCGHMLPCPIHPVTSGNVLRPPEEVEIVDMKTGKSRRLTPEELVEEKEGRRVADSIVVTKYTRRKPSC